jgi:hypothetical protein
VTRLRALWRRLFPPTDGSICEAVRMPRCKDHEHLGGPCRCLNLPHHGGGHECGQGARWDNYARSET